MKLKFKIIWLSIFILLVLVSVSVTINISNRPCRLGINFNGNTASGKNAIIRLLNLGDKPLKINQFCTLYWKNEIGEETNTFFRHDQGYAIVSPNNSILILIPHPANAKIWKMSITYQVEPGPVKRFYRGVLDRWFPGARMQEDLFSGVLSPDITNPAPTTFNSSYVTLEMDL